MGNQAMPRFGLLISDSFDSRPKAPKDDAYGRRVRHVEGVRIASERHQPGPAFSPLFYKAILTLALVATLTTSLAVWRLLTFTH
jgi:hypothetical protein